MKALRRLDEIIAGHIRNRQTQKRPLPSTALVELQQELEGLKGSTSAESTNDESQTFLVSESAAKILHNTVAEAFRAEETQQARDTLEEISSTEPDSFYPKHNIYHLEEGIVDAAWYIYGGHGDEITCGCGRHFITHTTDVHDGKPHRIYKHVGSEHTRRCERVLTGEEFIREALNYFGDRMTELSDDNRMMKLSEIDHALGVVIRHYWERHLPYDALSRLQQFWASGIENVAGRIAAEEEFAGESDDDNYQSDVDDDE